MKKKLTLYRKFILTNVIIIIASVILGSIITRHIIHYVISQKKMLHFPLVVAEKILSNDLSAQSPVSAFLRSMIEDPSFPENIWVVNNNLKLLYRNNKENIPTLSSNFSANLLPQETIQILPLGVGIIKNKKIPDSFILFKHRRGQRPGPSIHLIGTGIMLLAMILGMSILAIIIFHFFRKKAFIAEHVFNELKKGNLKARFPVKKVDEIGLVMMHFNSMAEEIERLVDELRKADQARVSLLQELAHDLRTPVSSMKTMLETIVDKWDSKDLLPNATAKEFAELSLSEANYFARLVEDLLFLAQVSEPKYDQQTQSIDIKKIIQNQIEIVEQQWPQITFSLTGNDFTILGDQHLLSRLFRNALINAASYAKQIVVISMKNSSIEIIDDGPGFEKNALMNFGIKKFSREVNPTTERLSVGLGSVIMKRIAEIHNGTLWATNVQPSGGKVSINFST